MKGSFLSFGQIRTTTRLSVAASEAAVPATQLQPAQVRRQRSIVRIVAPGVEQAARWPAGRLKVVKVKPPQDVWPSGSVPARFAT